MAPQLGFPPAERALGQESEGLGSSSAPSQNLPQVSELISAADIPVLTF